MTYLAVRATFDFGVMIMGALGVAGLAFLTIVAHWGVGKVTASLAFHASLVKEELSKETRETRDQQAVFQETTMSAMSRLENYSKQDHAKINDHQSWLDRHEGMLMVLTGEYRGPRRPLKTDDFEPPERLEP